MNQTIKRSYELQKMPQFPTPNHNYGTTQNSIYSSNINRQNLRQMTLENGAKFSAEAGTLGNQNNTKQTNSKREETLPSIKGSQNDPIE